MIRAYFKVHRNDRGVYAIHPLQDRNEKASQEKRHSFKVTLKSHTAHLIIYCHGSITYGELTQIEEHVVQSYLGNYGPVHDAVYIEED